MSHYYEPYGTPPPYPPYYQPYPPPPHFIQGGYYPRPHPRRSSWLRAFFKQVFGLVVIALALATLFLGSPAKYFPDQEIPTTTITPQPLDEMWLWLGEGAPSQDSAPMESEKYAREENFVPPSAPSQPMEPSVPAPAINPQDSFTNSPEVEESPRTYQRTPQYQSAPLTIVPKTRGSYIVQLSAAPELRAVKSFYYASKARNSDLLTSLRAGIQPVRHRNRPSFYRLYIFPFASRADAQDLCYQLQARGEDCFVKRR